jgi:hypothetical protein
MRQVHRLPVRLQPRLAWIAVLAIALPAFCQNAAMFRGNAQHSGVYDAVGVAKFTQVKWKFHVPGQVISSPAVAGDVVYVGNSDLAPEKRTPYSALRY